MYIYDSELVISTFTVLQAKKMWFAQIFESAGESGSLLKPARPQNPHLRIGFREEEIICKNPGRIWAPERLPFCRSVVSAAWFKHPATAAQRPAWSGWSRV